MEKTEKKRIRISLPWQILIGIAAGVLFGILLPQCTPYVEWAGDMFLNALNMIVIPLVASSIFISVAGMGETRNLGRIAGKTIAFYMLTTLVAIITGLALVTIIQPGSSADIPLAGDTSSFGQTQPPIIDQIVGIVPSNVFKCMAEGNLLPIIFFAIIMGIFSLQISEKHQQVLNGFFSAFYELTMKITLFVIRLTPIGVFAIVSCMISKQASEMSHLAEIAKGLGLFVLVTWAGCLIHGFITLPLTVWTLSRVNPYKHMKMVSTPLLTAFTTCSSGATLPLSIKYSQEKCGISNKLASFTLSLGSTINMNGTALFECVAALFIAQVYGIDLSIGQQISVVLVSLLSAVGAAGIPMAGIVMMTIVFNSVGLPLEGIGMILAVQQICEMPRTCLNVYGDLCGAVVIAKSEGEKLKI